MLLFEARRALLALLVISVFLQAYARLDEQSRQLLDAEEDISPAAADYDSAEATATGTCKPSNFNYRKTKKGCLCRKGFGTFVYKYNRSPSNPDPKRYPTTFPTGCKYYQPGTNTRLNFPTTTGRCFCFKCPSIGRRRYYSAGVGFLNAYASGCYPYRYSYARIHIRNTTCQALTANTVQYSQVQAAITKAFKARFQSFTNTFSPVTNKFTCTTGANGDAYIGFRLGYLGPFADAQQQIISDIITNFCQKTTLCTELKPLLPDGSTIDPVGEAQKTPLPPVTPGSSPAPPGSSPGPTNPSPNPPATASPSPNPGSGSSPSPNPESGSSPSPNPSNPAASPNPSPAPPASSICVDATVLNTGLCANLTVQNSNCSETAINPLDLVYSTVFASLGLVQSVTAINLIDEQYCVSTLCPALALATALTPVPGYALYDPSIPADGSLRCKCYASTVLGSSICTQTAGPYDVYLYGAGSTGPSPAPVSSPSPNPDVSSPSPNPGSGSNPSPTPPASPNPSPAPPASPICINTTLSSLSNLGGCATLTAQNSNCTQTAIDPLGFLYTAVLNSLGLVQTVTAINLVDEQFCVSTLCPSLTLPGAPSYALYAPSIPTDGSLRCKCYAVTSLILGGCTQRSGPYDIYEYPSLLG